ncbi:MAG: leucine--tRNA ligase [Candidatus Saccharimonas sp.]
MKRYNPSEIEPKWQQIWANDARYRAVDFGDKPKYYITGMFPYPSGAGMHAGHFLEHSIVDAVARFRRALGYNVLYPMGWDSFGLPAENYAIKTGRSPKQTVPENIANFKNQLQRVGASIDWTREINTSDPAYYKWTQWIFTKLFECGLAYQKDSLQWWCPKDKTVLANEQVIDGKCWRCDSVVIKKPMKQWFFKITAYADELLAELPEMDWPDKIKIAQRNWIGKSEGAEVNFLIDCKPSDSLKFTPELAEKIKAGAKTNTIRLGVKNLAAGDVAELMTRDGDTVESFGYAKITNTQKLPLKKVPNNMPGHESYRDDNEKLADFQKFYGNDVTLDSVVAVYDFEYIPPITVFTTRPDTIFGATYLVLAPEHPLARILAADDTQAAVNAYIDETVKKTEIDRTNDTKEKTGVFTGSYAVNPANGEKMPIWVADYVLGGYGTGVVMGVPAHDERDFAFAEKFELPVVEVIERPEDDASAKQCYHGEGILVNSGAFDGARSEDAREQIVAWLEQEGVGRAKTTYKMRDWLISRQRYWGAPIPIVHCPIDGAVAVPEHDLPVLLPDVDDFVPRGDGKSVLAAQEDWAHTTCPKCGGPAMRETDTMDGYACSSWYLLRYADPHNDQCAWGTKQVNYWAPVDMYVGGDHATAHLLYVRFWTHVFRDLGLTEFAEPVKRLVYHGLIQAEDGRKMSKSLGNVVDPLDVIDQGYGADALRTFELFLGPITENSSWSSRGIAGVYRFLNRLWTLVQEYDESDKSAQVNVKKLDSLTHATIKKVTDDIYRLSFNTAIAALMEYVNDLYKLKTEGFSLAWRSALETLVQLVQPFAPHMAAELWRQLGHDSQLDFVDWPDFDDAKIMQDTMTIVVQVNGKVRAKLQVATSAGEDKIKQLALSDESVKRYVVGEPKKVIYVKGKLISVVI